MKNLWLTLSAIGIIVVLVLLEILAWKEVLSWHNFAQEYLGGSTAIATFWPPILKMSLFAILIYSAASVLDWDANKGSFFKILCWWLLMPIACILCVSLILMMFSGDPVLFIVGRTTNTTLWIGNILLIFMFLSNSFIKTDSFFSSQFEDSNKTLVKKRKLQKVNNMNVQVDPCAPVSSIEQSIIGPVDFKAEEPIVSELIKIISSRRLTPKQVASIGEKFNLPEVWKQIALIYGPHHLDEVNIIVCESPCANKNQFFLAALCEHLNHGQEEDNFLFETILFLDKEASTVAWNAFAERLQNVPK